ncbi:MAG: class I SAM-dependent methyltransferase [Byssovorax sp.]
MASPKSEPSGDLSVTALYTAETWAWGGLPCAELFQSEDSKRVFGATNAALGVAGIFRKEPSLRHGLVQRHTLIDALLRRSGIRRVIELAAGLSRRGAWFTADPSFDYTEVDLPPVIAKKRALLERTAEGRAVLERPGYRLVAGDAASIDLASLAPAGEPLFVIAEGLFMYLQPDEQRALWSRIFDLLGRAAEGALVFDLVPTGEKAPPGAVGRALGGMMKRFTGGKTFEETARSRADILGELRAAGFVEAAALDPSKVAADYDLPFADMPTQQLVFTARAR